MGKAQALPLFPMENLATRDDSGSWAKCRNRYSYRVPCWPDTDIVEYLATIKPTNDGRWRWWQRPSDFHKGWRHKQGVAETAKEAAELALAPPSP